MATATQDRDLYIAGAIDVRRGENKDGTPKIERIEAGRTVGEAKLSADEVKELKRAGVLRPATADEQAAMGARETNARAAETAAEAADEQRILEAEQAAERQRLEQELEAEKQAETAKLSEEQEKERQQLAQKTQKAVASASKKGGGK